MASIARDGTEIVVKLSAGERLLAVRGDVRVPAAAVRTIEVVDAPLARVKGLRLRNFKKVGGYWPGLFAYGSFLDGSITTSLFAAVGRQPRGLEVTLDGAQYTRLIVGLDDPDQAKADLTAS